MKKVHILVSSLFLYSDLENKSLDRWFMSMT